MNRTLVRWGAAGEMVITAWGTAYDAAAEAGLVPSDGMDHTSPMVLSGDGGSSVSASLSLYLDLNFVVPNPVTGDETIAISPEAERALREWLEDRDAKL